MAKHLGELVSDKYARKPLLYLLVGRAKAYFFPDTLALLAAGDAVRSQTRYGWLQRTALVVVWWPWHMPTLHAHLHGRSYSKKDPAERAAELRALVSPALVAGVCEYINTWWRDHYAAEVVTETLLHADGTISCRGGGTHGHVAQPQCVGAGRWQDGRRRSMRLRPWRTATSMMRTTRFSTSLSTGK
jgi:hypothetical protein